MSLIEAFAILRSSRIVGKVMKSLNGNQGKIVRNVFCSLTRFWVVTAMALTGLSTLAQAQIFYAGQSASGKVAKVDGSVPSTFATYVGGDTQGITTDALGNVFVASGTSIYQITPGGSSSLYANYASPIAGLTMSSSGSLYGVRFSGGPLGGHDVGTYASNGTFTSLTLTNPGFVPFYPSNGLKFDGSGNLFVTNSGNGGTYGESVLKLTTADSGASWTVSAFASYTLGSTQPYDVTSDPTGNIYVSSFAQNKTILKYDSAGVLDGTFTLSGVTGTDTKMAGMTFANGNLYSVAYGGVGGYKFWEINPTTGVATNVIGGAFMPDYRGTFLTYTAVPEPSVMALVALGSLALLRRRVSRKTSLGFC